MNAPTQPTKHNTLMGMCSHDGRVDMETVKGLIGVADRVTGIIEICGTSHVALARNQVVAGLLRAPTVFEWFVFVDTDIGFTVRDFDLLLSHWERRVVVAPYPKKTREFLMNPGNPENYVTHGMGFCVVHRSVLSAILERMPVPCVIQGRDENDFFPTGVIGTDKVSGQRHYAGEDVGFWSLCDVAGFPPHLITDTSLRHVGRFVF